MKINANEDQKELLLFLLDDFFMKSTKGKGSIIKLDFDISLKDFLQLHAQVRGLK